VSVPLERQENVDIEAAMLGGILAGASVPSNLTTDDFYREEHRVIFGACLDLETPDEVAVVHHLREKSQLEAAGGAKYISSLTCTLPDVVNTDHWAQLIKRMSISRELFELGRQLQHAHSEQLTETIGNAREQLGRLDGSLSSTRRRSAISSTFLVESYASVADLELPSRDYLVYPWLPERGLAMLYAPKGAGKTYFALTVAVALVAGINLFGWETPKARRVVFVDGELEVAELRERIAAICRGMGLSEEATRRVGSDLFILSRDRMASEGLAMGYLQDLRSQENLVRELPHDTDLVVFDNLSCLFGGEENDAAAWDNVLLLLLRLKNEIGASSLFLHHSGKSGEQRGTSRREDNLDTSIKLEPITAKGEVTASRARFRTVWAKHRGFTIEEAPSTVLELHYDREEMIAVWTTTRTEDVRVEIVAEEFTLLTRETGAPPTVNVLFERIQRRADQTGREDLRFSRSTTHNLLKKARSLGLLEAS
jgi:putative DNA primase/helicase